MGVEGSGAGELDGCSGLKAESHYEEDCRGGKDLCFRILEYMNIWIYLGEHGTVYHLSVRWR